MDSIMIDDLIQIVREIGIHNGARDALFSKETTKNNTAGIRSTIIDIEEAINTRYGMDIEIYKEYFDAYINEFHKIKKEFEING